MTIGVQGSDRQPTWGGTLRRFLEKPPALVRCELCAAELADEHEHLVDPATRKLLCACTSCAILFGYQADMKYRRVPRRIEALRDFRITDMAWAGLGIPIGLAFFFYSSAAKRVSAMYPSPAGATQSLLELESWEKIARHNPVLRELQPDVEALLVKRTDAARAYYRAPIDECYKLVGLIRSHWTGFSGGSEVWTRITQFFASLDRRAVK